MASTVQGQQLTRRHRTAQLAVRAAALREVLELWPTLNPLRLDDTAAAWVRLMLRLVARFRGESAERAVGYFEAFRAAETGLLVPPPRLLVPDTSTQRVATSLAVTGPARIKWLTGRGVEPDRAARIALRDVAGATGRHVLDGGRDMLDVTVAADETALGWARVTAANPCHFCAMLASRGPVYESQATALRTTTRSGRGAGKEYHDGCACTTEPVFSREQDWPGRGREFEQLWAESTAGYSGRAAMNAFRRAYEAQRRTEGVNDGGT